MLASTLVRFGAILVLVAHEQVVPAELQESEVIEIVLPNRSVYFESDNEAVPVWVRRNSSDPGRRNQLVVKVNGHTVQSTVQLWGLKPDSYTITAEASEAAEAMPPKVSRKVIVMPPRYNGSSAPTIEVTAPQENEHVPLTQSEKVAQIAVVVRYGGGINVPQQAWVRIIVVESGLVLYGCPTLFSDPAHCGFKSEADAEIRIPAHEKLNDELRYLIQFHQGRYTIALQLVEPHTLKPLSAVVRRSFMVTKCQWDFVGDGFSRGRVGEVMTFDIVQRKNTGCNLTGAVNFVVRLHGPTVFTAAVTEIEPGQHRAEYVPVDAGEHFVMVWLAYYHSTGTEWVKGDEKTRGTYAGSLLTPVRPDGTMDGVPVQIMPSDPALGEYNQVVQPMRWCERDEIGRAAGRWVDRAMVAERGIYSQSELDEWPAEHYRDYIWIPYSCRYRPLSFEHWSTCVQRHNYDFLVVGSSVERTYWHDLLQFAEVQFDPVKVKDYMEHTNDVATIRFFFYAQLIGNCTMQPKDIDKLTDLIASKATKTTTVLVVSGGIAEALGCSIAAVKHNFQVLAEVVERFQGIAVWISPPAVIDWRTSLLWRVGWSVTNYRMRKMWMEWDRHVAKLDVQSGRRLAIDTFQMIESRMDATTDGVHHYSFSQYLMGGPTSKFPMQIMSNALCYDEIADEWESVEDEEDEENEES